MLVYDIANGGWVADVATLFHETCFNEEELYDEPIEEDKEQ